MGVGGCPQELGSEGIDFWIGGSFVLEQVIADEVGEDGLVGYKTKGDVTCMPSMESPDAEPYGHSRVGGGDNSVEE